MITIPLLMLLIAVILFALAAFNVGGRFNMVAAGLAFWAGSELVMLL
jgi:hypothetical protein